MLLSPSTIVYDNGVVLARTPGGTRDHLDSRTAEMGDGRRCMFCSFTTTFPVNSDMSRRG
jgi:hypothetical protein